MFNKLQYIFMISGVTFAILGMVFAKTDTEIYLNMAIMGWILNTFLCQRKIDKLENK